MSNSTQLLRKEDMIKPLENCLAKLLLLLEILYIIEQKNFDVMEK